MIYVARSRARPLESTRVEKATWNQLQLDLLRLSSQSARVIAERSHHYIQQARPEVVIDAISRLVAEARAQSQRR